MEKQIEEMAEVIEETVIKKMDSHCDLPSVEEYATDLYNAGYRKQSEGEWVQSKDWQYDYICSVCGNTAHKGDYGNYDSLSKFCPNCGAKMKGGAE